MINDPKSIGFISWNEHGSSFMVTNIGEFSRSILGSHFKHNNFSSFVRQLNMYGFHKVNRTPRAQRTSTDAQTWEFSHPKFLRGRTDLLDDIKRKTLEQDVVTTKQRVELPVEVAQQLTRLAEDHRRALKALAAERHKFERLTSGAARMGFWAQGPGLGHGCRPRARARRHSCRAYRSRTSRRTTAARDGTRTRRPACRACRSRTSRRTTAARDAHAHAVCSFHFLVCALVLQPTKNILLLFFFLPFFLFFFFESAPRRTLVSFVSAVVSSPSKNIPFRAASAFYIPRYTFRPQLHCSLSESHPALLSRSVFFFFFNVHFALSLHQRAFPCKYPSPPPPSPPPRATPVT
ncbi:HSF-type DNA-binding-domain-containing protein [Gautieria morchelliformis]|nr:HSF-type DNA-binding-domain-containing protein [Gautieria morchelliformis]